MAKRLIGRKIKVLVRKSWFTRRPVKVIVGLLAIILLAVLPLLRAKKTQAEITSFFASTCSGGWENTDKVTGAPNVVEGGLEKYSDLNSASILNTDTQINCGGFKGELPQDAIQKKVTLKFSWTSNPAAESIIKSEPSIDQGPIIIPDTPSSEPSIPATPTPEIQPSPVSPDTQPIQDAPSETIPPKESSFLQNLFLNSAHAQENDSSTDTPSAAQPEIPAGAIFEARYTFDNVTWKTLGYVTDINNDVSFEIPVDITSTIADLEQIQISLQALPSIDSTPKIYLDSMWLEVEYLGSSAELTDEEIAQLPRVNVSNVFKTTTDDFRADEEPKFEVDANSLVDTHQKETGPAITPTASPEISPTASPEVTPEVTPEVAPEVNSGSSSDQTPATLPDILDKPSSMKTDLNKFIAFLDSFLFNKNILTAFAQDAITPTDTPVDSVAPTFTDTPATTSTDSPALSPTDTIAPSSTDTPTTTTTPTTTEAPALPTTPPIVTDLRIIKSEVTDPQGAKADLQPVVQDVNGTISVDVPKPTNDFLPGKYTMDVEILKGRIVYVSTENFTWGVLAINTNKSIYQPNETAYLQMGALDDTGNTVCDADLQLKIKNETLNTETDLSTADGTIQFSKTCGANNVTDNPDYFANYKVGDAGTYQMALLRIDPSSGATIYEITDSFAVKDSVPFDVERIGATRTNPFLSTYVMTLKIKANQDFDGDIVESVPAAFTVTQTDDTQQKDDNGKKLIIWRRNVRAGDTINLSYEYQGPKLSPQSYVLGPLQFTNHINWLERLFGADDILYFQEARQWQIASDSLTATWTGTVNGNWSNGGNWSSGTAPNAGDNLVFPSGASNLSNTNDLIQNTLFNSITFTGSGYTLAGNDIVIANGVAGITDSVSSGGNTISLNIRLDATRNIFVTNSGETLTISGMIGGAGGFTKEGVGMLVLSGANSYAGITTINAGIVSARNDEALGSIAAGTSVVGGAELQLQGTINIGYEALTLRGFGVSSGGALHNVSNNNSFAGLITLVAGGAEIASDSGTLTLTGGVTGAFNLNIDGASNTTFDLAPVAIGAGTLTKNGSGTLQYNFPNTYTGPTIINSGKLLYGIDNAILTSAITVNNGTLDMATFSDMVGAVTLGLVGGASTPTITGTTGVLTSTGFTVNSGTISAIIAGDAVTVTKNTPGTVILTRPNLFTGAVAINAGVLDVRDSGALGVIDGTTTVTAGATLLINGSGLSIPEYITISGTGMLYTGAIRNTGGNNTLTGVITLAAAASIEADSSTTLTIDTKGISAVTFGLNFGGAGNITTTSSAPIWGTSASLTKNDTGTVTIGGYSNITGATILNAGIVILSGSGAIPSSAVTINSGATLTVDNSTTNMLNRLSSSALTMNGGNFNFTGSNTTSASESTGALTLSTGHNIVTVTPGSGGSTTFTFASLSRTAGATVLFRGTNLGTTPAANVSTIMFTAAPTLTGASGAANSATISVIKGGFGDTSLSGTGSDMVTYNVGNTNGLRLLNQAGFSGEYASNFSTINTNVKLTAGTAATTQSINSLILNGFDVTNPGSGQTLTMASGSLSGNILINSANNIAGTNTTIGITTNELDVLASANSTITAIIGTAVAGSMTVSGTGNVTLSAASAYTGLTAVNKATLTEGNSNVLSSGGVTVNNGTFDIGANSDTVGAVTLQDGTITGGTGILTGTSYSFQEGTVSAIIAGAVTVTRVATNAAADSVVLMTRNNTYSGVTTITSGILRIGGAGDGTNTPLGTTGGGTTIATIAALDLNGYTLSTAEPITSLNGLGYGLAATVAAGNSNMGAIMNTSSTGVSYSGAITLGAASRINSDSGSMTISSSVSGATLGLTLGGFSDWTFSGAIGTTTGTLTKDGFGTLTLSGNSSYTGATTISLGKVKIAAAGDGTNSPLGTIGGATSITSGAMLDLNGVTLSTAEPLTINGTGFGLGDFAQGALTNTSGTAVTYSGLLTLGAASTIITNNGDINLSNAGTIGGNTFGLTIGGSGNGSITSIIGTTSGTVNKIGTGTWTLSGASTFTGATTVSNGTLKLGATGGATNTPLGTTGTGTTVNSGAVLDLNTFTLGTAEALTLNGRGINDGGALVNNSGSGVTYSGAITLASDTRTTNSGAGALTLSGGITTAGFTIRMGGAGNTTLSTVAVSGTGGITKDGAGTLTNNFSQTYTGATIIEAGTFQYGASGLLAVTAVTVNGGTWDMGGITDTVGVVTLIDGAINNGTLTGATNYTMEKGTIGAVLAGASPLIKNRQGTVTMTGANSISSTATINGGKLILSGSGTAVSATFTINLGGTLTLDNSSTNIASRLGDALALTMNGGNFNFIGSNTASTNAAETTGALTPVSGHNVVTVTPGTGGSTTMSFTTLTRSAGATVLFRGTGLGSTPAANISTLTFPTTPPGLTGAGGAANSTTISIIKGCFGDSSLSGTGSDMVTYNIGNTNGLRLLNGAGFSGEYAAAFGTANANVKLTAGTAATTQSINSLILNGFDVTNPGSAQTLTLASASLSGNILMNSANTIAGANTTIGITTIELPILVSANATISAIIGTATTGSLDVSGTGNLTISAAAAYTGTTFINNATLTYGNNNIISSGAVTVVGGTYNLAGNSDTIGALNINAGTVASGAGTLTLGGTVTTTANNNVSSTISGNLGLGATRSFNIADGTAVDNDVVISAVISGGFAITKDTGTGVLVFSGSNTYSGTTTINAGTLRLGATGDATNTPLGTTAGGTLVVGASSALDLNGYTLGTSEALSLNGALAGGALQNLSSATATYNGLITLAGASTIISNYGDINIANSGTITGATFGLTIGGSGNGTLASIIGTTSGTLTKNGVGMWTLSGNSTYTGTTTISAGTFRLGTGGSSGNGPLGTTGNATSITSGAMLDLNGNTLNTAEAITPNGTGIIGRGAIINNSSSATGYSGVITLGTAPTIANYGSGTLTLSGNIVGSTIALTIIAVGPVTQSTASVWSGTTSTLTKQGSGVLTLGGQNSITGAMTVSTGTLRLGDNGGSTNTPFGTIAGGVVVSAGAVLDLSTFTSGGASTWEPITLNGSGINNGGALISNSSTGSTFGVLTLQSASRIINSGSGAITFAGAPTGTFNYIIGGTGPTTFSAAFPAVAITVTKFDSGTLTFSAANLYTGLTRINGGTLKYGIADALATGAVTVAGGTLDLGGFNETNIGTVTLISGSIINSGSAASITSTATYALESGTISAQLGSAVAAGISKTTAGQVILSGDNTFTSTSIALTVGSLNARHNNALGASGTTLTTTISAGATLELQNNITIPSTKLFTINGAGVSAIGAIRNVSDSNTIQSAITLTAINPRINSDSGTLTISGNIGGATFPLTVGGAGSMTISGVIGTTSGTLTKDGGGTATLTTATNTYTGLTTVSAGVLNIQNAASLGTTASGTVVNSGAALQIQGTITVGAEALTLNGNGVSNDGALRNIANNNTYQGTITLASDSSIGSDSGTLTLSGTITGGTSIDLTTVGAGTIAPSNSVNLGGNFTISAGTVTAASNTFTIAGSWSNSGTFTASSSTVLLNGGNTVSVSGTTTFNNLTITHTSAKEVDFQTSGTPTFTISGLFTVTGHTGAAIKLYSDSSPTQWTIHPTGTYSIDWADVKDSACAAGSINMNPTNFTSSNNGFCWALPSITMSLSDSTISFGTLSILSARYATNTSGSGVETVAHTINVSTNAGSGYTLYVQGNSLTNTVTNHVISAIGTTPAASNPGNEQFGIRATVSGGTATIGAPYANATNYGYDATSTVQSIIGSATAASTDTYSLRYLGNIGFTTDAGAYSTTLTYTAVGSF